MNTSPQTFPLLNSRSASPPRITVSRSSVSGSIWTTGFAALVFLLFFSLSASFCANAAEAYQVNINSENELRAAITQINSGGYSGYDQVVFTINTTIELGSDLEELNVPSGSTTQFTFTGKEGESVSLIGNGNRGFVISATDQSTVSFSNLTLSKFTAEGEDGEDGNKSGGGGGAGLGGAIYVKSGKVSLLDVKFQNNKAIGGDGGTYDADASQSLGSGGQSSDGSPSGGTGRNTITSTDEAAFGGGGGGSPNEDNIGAGGLGAGDGGYLVVDEQIVGGTGGGGLGAGGAVFVESGATLSVQYSDSFDSTTAFSSNTVLGGTAGGTAEDGNALGNMLFAGGNVVFDTSTPDGGNQTVTISKNQTIGGLAGTVDLSTASQTELSEIKANSGDITIVGGGTLLMQGENLSLGKVIVEESSTLVVENGKAISDYSELSLSNGAVLELKSNETIGYLNGSGVINLFHTSEDGETKTGGKTLTIGGDEYSSDFDGVEVGNGLTVLGDTITAFSGIIVTDHNTATQEYLVKTGNGLLILAGDNTNLYAQLEMLEDEDGNLTIPNFTTYQDDFIVQLQGGTIQVNHSNALGGGQVNVRHSDTEIERNMLQAGAETLNLGNTFHIQTSNPFRIGVSDDLAANTDVELTLSGQIIGNHSIMVNMGNQDQVLKLTNYSTEYSEANQINQIQLNQGTLAVVGDYLRTYEGNGTQSDPDVYEWKNSAGSAKIVALAGSDNNAQFQIDTQGLVFSNQIVVESGALTITNGYDDSLDQRVSKFTLSGVVSGTGGLNIDLSDKDDVAILSGHLNGNSPLYTGDTKISNGILQFAYNETTNKSTTIQMSGGLVLTNDGTLDLNGNWVSFAGKGVYDIYGKITDSSTEQTGVLVKAGTGTWNLNLQEALGQLMIETGTVVLQNDHSLDKATILKGATLALGTDAQMESVSGELNSILDVGEHTLTLAGNGTIFYGNLSGGKDARIIVGDGATETPDLDLYGSSTSTWSGTIEVSQGANLRVSSIGALGRLTAAEDGSVGTVLLDRSTLSVNTYNGPAALGRLQIANSGPDSFGIINTLTSYDVLYTYDVVGSGTVIKQGYGTLNLMGSNDGFSGDIQLEEGYVVLQNNAQIGSGKLISDGDASRTNSGTEEEIYRTLVVFADENADSRTFGNDIVINEKLRTVYSDAPELILSGDVSGSANWSLMGGGKFVLAGNYDNYNGEISVNTGTYLQLGAVAGQGDINLRNSKVVVEGGAMFDASGTIHSLNVKSNGILQIYENSVLKITDELNLASGSIIAIECVGSGSNEMPEEVMVFGAGLGAAGSGTIVIDSGTATINGGVVYLNASNIQVGDTFTLITTENDGTILFNENLTLVDNANGVRAVGSFNEATGEYTYTFLGFDYGEGANTDIRKTMGAYLNNIVDNTIISPEFNEALDAIENYIIANPDNGMRVYDELSGQVYASMGGAQIHAATMLNQSLASQLRPGARAGQLWDGTGETSYLGQAYSECGLTGWMTAYGMFGETDDDGSASGYDLDVYGGLIALERCSYNMSRRIGFYYGYGQTKINTGSSFGKGTSDDNRLGLYLKWDDSLGYGILSGGVGFNSYKFNRSVLGTGYKTDMNGIQTSFYAERGVSCRSGWGIFQPYVGIQYVYQDQDSFSESGYGLLGLYGESVSTNSLRSMFGVRFVKDFGCAYGRGASQFYLQGHWMHEYLDEKSEFRGSIISPTTFTVNGNEHGRDWAVLGVGADWFATNQAQIFGSYDAQFNGDSLFHIGTVGVRVVW